jgi:hypothetical protein
MVSRSYTEAMYLRIIALFYFSCRYRCLELLRTIQW